ncbi:hypothetical protein LQK83_04325 [Rhizobium sp. C1]|nr:hypothetical protein [Rhizobium sp. C1]
MLRVLLLTASVLTIQNAPSPSTGGNSPSAEPWLIRMIASQRGGNLVEVKQRMASIFTGVSGGQDSIDRQFFERRDALARAEMRAQFVSGLLRKDVDGDGQITKSDLDIFYAASANSPLRSNTGISISPTKEQAAEILEKAEAADFAYDGDGNGKITLTEILAAAASKSGTSSFSPSGGLIPADRLETLDADGDKSVSKAEFLMAVEKAYRWIDRNGDGVLSPEEIRDATLVDPRGPLPTR